MKSILELISMMTRDGSSAITDVKIRINQLMELTGDGFNVDESTSRSSEDGALTDLRTSRPLTTSDLKAIEIRRRLTFLQNKHNLIKFEEKINEDTNQSTFIITEVAYPEFLNKTLDDFQFPAQDTHSTEVNSVVIRTGLHDIHCKYINVHVGDQIAYPIQDLQVLEVPSSQEHDSDVITYMKKNNESTPSIMDYLSSQDQKNFHAIKRQLNQFCELTTNNEFALYFQSSNPEFPVDLRVFLDINDEKAKNAQSKLSGFVLGMGLIYEVKTFDKSDQIAIIIKAINKKDLNEYFIHSKQVHLEGEQLKRSLALIKEYFPQDKHIQDLVIVSGKGSYSRPFPHIRTQKFWSRGEVSPSTHKVLLSLEKIGCIDFGERPENKFTVEKRNKAHYQRALPANSNFFNAENDNYQWIIVPKDIDRLKKELDNSFEPSSTYLGA